MKKFDKVEKVLLASVDVNNYTTFRCDEHGVFQQRNDCVTGVCNYCKKKYEPLSNVEELKEKFCKELNW